MSIIITNTTPEESRSERDQYILRINNLVLCSFSHKKKTDGVGQCLRDAAVAYERLKEKEESEELEKLLPCPCCKSKDLRMVPWETYDGECEGIECNQCLAGAPKKSWAKRR